MPWEIVPVSQFHNVKSDWSRISRQFYQDHPLLDAGMVTAALESFADDKVILAVERDDAGTQSIVLLRKMGIGSWQTFSPSQLPITLFLTSRNASIAEILHPLFRRLQHLVLMIGLTHYDRRYFRAQIEDAAIESIEYARTMSVSTAGEFQDFWMSRSKNLRKSIRRYQRKLEKQDVPCRMEIVTTAGEMDGAVARYGAIESAGWKGRHGSAIHAENIQGKFYRSIMNKFAKSGAARVFHLSLDNKIVASRLAVIKNGMMVILKTTYDEEYAQYAPGRLLLFEVLNYAFSEPEIREVEFYTNATQDQLQWAGESRTICHENVYVSPWMRKLAQSVRSVRKRISKK